MMRCMGMHLNYGLGFGFVAPGVDDYVFENDEEYDLMSNFPLLSYEGSGVGDYRRTVVVIKSTLFDGWDDPKEFHMSELTHTITNEELDELSAAKEALGLLYAQFGFDGEYYPFSPVGYFMFGSYS